MAESSWILPLSECRDRRLVGDKAVGLAALARAGFAVPDGFVVTTEAFRQARLQQSGEISPALATAITGVYRGMGSPPVAVRSSPTAEDTAEVSMAGRFQPSLGVDGEEALLQAVRRCLAGTDAPRARSYLDQHDLDAAEPAMAMVVQKLVSAATAGVLFTANPRTGDRSEMLIEARGGSGDAMVSGAVQPDTLVLDRATGAVKRHQIAEKPDATPPDSPRQQPDPPRQQPDPPRQQPSPEADGKTPCLTPSQVEDLWQVGLRVEQHFGSPQDVAWAIHDGQLYLLQSRAVTAVQAAESYAHCLTETRRRLAELKRQGRGDWVRHNLAETLPHPTPLSWSLIGQFMSGDGGFGALYREVGVRPSEAVCRDGFLDLIAGRIYMDLSRAAEMFFPRFPLAYDPALPRADPDAAARPPTLSGGSRPQRARAARKMAAVSRRLEELAADCDRKLEDETFPAMVEWVGQQKGRNLQELSTQQWLELWRQRAKRVLDDFAPKALLPGLIAAMAVQRLEEFAREDFWDDDPRELVDLLSVAGLADLTLEANQDLHEVACGGITAEAWIDSYGHRGPEEFDLAAPRWRDRPGDVNTMALRLTGATAPAAEHRQRAEAARLRADQLAARLSRRRRREFRRRVSLVHRYLRFREDGKHYLMLGYDLLRDMALEAGRRMEIGQNVFLLSFDELRDALITGFVPRHLIRGRRLARAAERRLVLPPVISEAEITSLGEPPPPNGLGRCDAMPISTGACAGAVQVVDLPQQDGGLGREDVPVGHGTDPGGADADDVQIAWDTIPPVRGPRERRSAAVRNLVLAIWGACLLAAFLLPAAWVYRPSLELLDEVLWPLVVRLGKPATVAAVAGGLAVFTMLAQWLLTDNRRLRTAKRRAKRLRRQAARLPRGSPRRTALIEATAGVQRRLVAAALLPLAIVLGPMVVSLSWLAERVDPASANAGPGAVAYLTATVDGEYLRPVTLSADSPLELDPATPAAQSIRPVRPALQKLRAKWQRASDLSDQPREVQAAAEGTRRRMLADLDAQLAGRMPEGELSWTVRTPREQSGRWPVTLTAEGIEPVSVRLVLGDLYPPPPREDLGDGKGRVQVLRPPKEGSPMRAIKVVYADRQTREDEVFFAPFEKLNWSRLDEWGLRSWDAGWLLSCVAVYLPVMLLLRLVLRIP